MTKMKSIKSMIAFTFSALLMVSMVLSSCNGAAATTSALSTTTSTSPASTTSAAPRTTPPTVQELEEGHFLYPEIQRITAQQIKTIIDKAKEAGEYKGSGAMISWDNFIIIDVRSSKGEVLGAPGFGQPGHILGARSMPMTWYWVTDPREDPKQEEKEAYEQELTALEENIGLLPKGLPIYIYDGTADDEAAGIVATMILEAGFPAKDVNIIWKGFAYWYYDLQYPIVQGDYNFEGE